MTTTAEAPIVVIGAGQAGGELCAALRMSGYAGDLVLIGEEEHLPYSRPPLSKAFLLGTKTRDDLKIRGTEFYEVHGIRTVTGHRAVSVDRGSKQVVLDDHGIIAYSSLVFATGGEARRLGDQAADSAPNVHYIRTISDVEALKKDLVVGARLTVIGGGFVGLEVAAAARKLGIAVTVIEAGPRLLGRVAGVAVSSFFHRLHTEEGVDVRLDASLAGFDLDSTARVANVRLSDGAVIATDVVVIGIGLVPNASLAADAGLDVNGGIVVDEFCRTSDPRVYAIGDCTIHPCGEHGGMRRLESVANASEQARVAADAITGGTRAYRSVPWFWSDQYNLTLQSVGLASSCETVVMRGDAEVGRTFAAFYLKDGEVRAADVVGSPRDFALAKKLVGARMRLHPGDLANVDLPLKEILGRPGLSAPA
ncbi:FAD-dependent oxidoreductase [soil metagenome]